MILVDTSVWVDHLYKGSPVLAELLREEQVLCHPFVVGELACGNLRNRDEILTLLWTMPHARMADDKEVLHLIEVEALYGRGIGWVDAHLLASSLITKCRFWTQDRRLQQLARSLSIPSRTGSKAK